MKAVIALTASLSVASAALLPRQLDSIPQCALSCALSSLGSTGCQTTDFACICQASAFINGLVPCVQSSCSASEFDATIAAASGLCSSAGVSLSIPAGAASTSAATSAASSVSSAAETTSAPSSAATTEVTSAATTSAPSSAASSESSAAETTSAATSAAPTTSTRGNSTVSGTAPPQPTGTEPGAASRNTVALGGLGAIVALVAAFL